jgi:hypothetical protein
MRYFTSNGLSIVLVVLVDLDHHDVDPRRKKSIKI